ncbi:MAG: hypothetical protein E4H03_10650 [Myxococcales bacterium]|nr:MAG: hypothetical protein E4H03_10650 [Myxococcales bacterium]
MSNRSNDRLSLNEPSTGGDRTDTQRVMLAVLQDAVKTFEQGLRSQRAIDRQRFHEVDRWVASPETDWPFTFENVCASLGLDPDYMRDGLRRLKVEAFQSDGNHVERNPALMPRRSHPRRR